MKKRFIQKGPAKKSGSTIFGRSFAKGDEIVHLSSNRSTGEVFTLVVAELSLLRRLSPKPLLSRKERIGR